VLKANLYVYSLKRIHFPLISTIIVCCIKDFLSSYIFHYYTCTVFFQCCLWTNP